MEQDTATTNHPYHMSDSYLVFPYPLASSPHPHSPFFTHILPPSLFLSLICSLLPSPSHSISISDGAISLLFKVLTKYIQSPSTALPDDLLTGTDTYIVYLSHHCVCVCVCVCYRDYWKYPSRKAS